MSDSTYFDYLMTISSRGKFYRRHVVYPRIGPWLQGKTLDVGCGIGLFLEWKAGAIGVDINSECVEYCQKQGHNSQTMEYDVLPFDDASFDTLVFDNVIEHIADPMPILNESKRVLRSSGRVIILVPGKKGYKNDPDHKVFYDFDGLRELADRVDMKVVSQSSLPLPGMTNALSLFCYMVVLELKE